MKPEVVLLDIGLPGMDGYEVARHLRTEHDCPDALLIAVSGYGQPMTSIAPRTPASTSTSSSPSITRC